MPFLGAETALPCVGGRRVGNFPIRGPGGQNRLDFLGEEIPGDILAGFWRPHGQNWLTVNRTIERVFRRKCTEKVQVWYRSTP